MPDISSDTSRRGVRGFTDGAVGAGLVLVVLPCLALYYAMDKLAALPVVGLPIMAVFGIMILFGSLALVASLFYGLKLADNTQPFGLPDGSIRAAIALSLIVLFAIIAIMLHQSEIDPYDIPGLTVEQKDAMVKDLSNHVVAIVPTCDTSGDCSKGPFSVRVRQPQSPEASDLAKQLLTLIGTLMASVTSFYFATRSNDSRRTTSDLEPSTPSSDPAGTTEKTTATTDTTTGSPPGEASNNAAGTVATTAGTTGTAGQSSSPIPDTEIDIDGCDIAIENSTRDEDLPAARGGVAR